MRTPILFSLCMGLLVFCVNPTQAKAQCTYVKTVRLGGSTLNIRPAANTNQASIGSVPEGACLAVLQTEPNGQNINVSGACTNVKTWYKIKYNNVTGWISGCYADCSTCGGPPPECSAGQTRACYTGPSGTKGVGICKEGTQGCSSGKWGSCSGEVKPGKESCNGKDDDCDSKVDEGNPGGGGNCTDKGCTGAELCENGKIVCRTTGGGSTETCDGIDNDCNGQIDDGVTRPCYSGPPNTNGVGRCKGGTQSCTLGKWGACTDEILPGATEVCGNNTDDNCDGQVDEGCGTTTTCNNGETRPCYSGAAATKDVGACRVGTQTCQFSQWGACQGEVVPTQEVCGNNIDDDCNGQVDDNCGTTQPGDCVDNDKDGYGIGPGCKGLQDCDDNDKAVNPGASEICGNGKDDDCNGGDAQCGKLNLGEEGCRKTEDCLSNFCVSLDGIHRCSQPCKERVDCPAGYECVQGQACWPSEKRQIPPSDFPKSCQSDPDCPAGERCDRGFCSKETTSGCGCSEREIPSSGALWFLLLFGILLRRRTVQTFSTKRVKT
ncbi:MAG: SH3 domain-containing protein [Myxococcales bacterium]|nr:SH3 domain-containing protein [Myxococcales bacterium]